MNTEVTAAFLDAEQYTHESIAAYEAVFGRDFLSPGGRETAAELTDRLGLTPGQRVLDVGSGLGGSAFLMARERALTVDGIDLSRNMVERASRRLRALGLDASVSFIQGDCLELDRPARYHAVYSRDVFLHVHDKAALLDVLMRCLCPGGKLLFTDYCASPKPWSQAFTAYVEQRAYHLLTIEQYAAALRAGGFVDVVVQDRTPMFIEILRRERAAIPANGLAPDTIEKLIASWDEKIARAELGEQRWGLAMARRA